LYLSPCSPDKNPIELMVNQWKTGLQRFAGRGDSWIEVHLEALYSVTPTHASNHFFHCKIPGCDRSTNDDDTHAHAGVTAAIVAMLFASQDA
jgi:hypothetical protein